ncbi:MAG: TIGR01777 family oxidoreductase [Bacteroidota bacterium]
MAVILITGGTGLVGKALTERLLAENHEVRLLSRNPKPTKTIKSFYWNLEKNEIDEKALHDVTHVVHLAGTGIADKRWTSDRKKEIIDSRVNSMKLLTSEIINQNIRLTSFVGASAIGFYGMNTSEKNYLESDYSGNDFLSDVCVQWENSYNSIAEFSTKTCIVRTGVVLSKHGGALKKLIPLFKLGLGSALGNGKQYMPWIHIEDLVSVYMKTLFDPEYIGIYNAVSLEHICNKDFSKQLAKSLSRPFFMPAVPGLALKLILGKMAELLLTGSRVSNQKLLDIGFKFKFPSLFMALKEITSENKL